MSRGRKEKHEDLELRFQLISELTVLERDDLISDIDRAHGKAVRSVLKRRFRLDDDES